MLDVLKIDIESDEWKCLPQMLSNGILQKYVKQLDIEFHVGREPSVLRRQYGIVLWLDKQGFKITTMHKNMFCWNCFEASYVNTNLIKIPVRT